MARRNPRMNTNLLLVAGLAVGGYLVYRWLAGAASRAVTATGAAASAASSSVADVLEQIFPHSIGNTVFPAGTQIMLPDASVIPASVVSGVASFTDTDDQVKLQFYYQGRTYRTLASQPDSAGMFYAA